MHIKFQIIPFECQCPNRLGLFINAHLSNLFNNFFFFYYLRPKYFKDVSTISSRKIDSGLFAVVMQGPIQKLMGTMQAVPSKLVRTVDAVKASKN